MSALIIDIILWCSVAMLAVIAWQRGRLVLTASVREGHHGLHQYRAAHRARRDRFGIYRRGDPCGNHHWLARPKQRLARCPHCRNRWRRDAGRAGGRVFDWRGGAEERRRRAPQVLAYVVAWALFAFQRLLLWEIPFMPARFVWFRAAVSVPFPFLAAAVAMAIGRP
jgi:hypothetical protein